MVLTWLHVLSIASIAVGALRATIIGIDVACPPQHMWIMDIVWPVTALFGTIWIVWQYFSFGQATHETAQKAKQQNQDPPNMRLTPFPLKVANGSLHCGSGCTLGDIVAEWLAFGFPAVAIAFGWQSIFRRVARRLFVPPAEYASPLSRWSICLKTRKPLGQGRRRSN